MKMPAAIYAEFKRAVSPHMTGPSERQRWDALWASGYDIYPLYDQLNDDHIDTALRRVWEETQP